MEIIKVPFSNGSLGKNIGCELAPEIITKMLGIKSTALSINQDNIDKTGKVLYDYIKSSNNKLFLIGGDHSITYYSFKAFSEKNENCGLMVFDAHPDMQSSDFVTHEDYLRILIKDKLIDPKNLVIVGLRSVSKEEFEFLKENKIVYFDMNKIYDLGIKEVCDLITERMLYFSSLYVSIDIDVVDPAYAPGTGYLEPGGISSLDLLYIINRIRLMRNLKMADLVEINPAKDINNITTLLGCRIVEAFL